MVGRRPLRESGSLVDRSVDAEQSEFVPHSQVSSQAASPGTRTASRNAGFPAIPSARALIRSGPPFGVRYQDGSRPQRIGTIVRSPSGAEVTGGHRLFGIVDGALLYAHEMSGRGQTLAPHLSARLLRVGG